MKITRILNNPWAAAALAVTALPLAIPSAHAATVWNVNIGPDLTTSDDFVGAAPENTVPNSFWNSVTTANPTAMTLADSTGTATTATLTLTGPISYGGYAPITGPDIFDTWIKSTDNATPFTMMIGGLSSSPGVTYDLIVYSDWYWKANQYLPVTQTVGSGLTGTVYLNRSSAGTDAIVTALIEDTNPANTTAVQGNWLRIEGLTPDGSGNLAFSMGGRDTPLNGFQLIQIPEPSAALLGGLGLLALLRRRR